MSAKSPAKSKKKVVAKKDHPVYSDMIVAAIKGLANRNGSSKVAISKYIVTNYKGIGDRHSSNLRTALLRGLKNGVFVKKSGIGCAGSFKLPADPKKKRAASKTKSAVPKKKGAPKKKGSTPKKKAPAPKRKKVSLAAAKKAPKKKVAPKKKAALPKKRPSAKKAAPKKK